MQMKIVSKIVMRLVNSAIKKPSTKYFFLSSSLTILHTFDESVSIQAKFLLLQCCYYGDQIIIMRSEIILKAQNENIYHKNNIKNSKSKIGLFSLILFCTLLFGVWQWYSSLQTYLATRKTTQFTHYQWSRIIQLDNNHSFQQSILKYKLYLVFTCGYVEPNIILAICIFLTFGFTINSLETQTATLIAFYEYNGNSIYLQIIRLGLDGIQYALTGRCYCLNSGAGCVWLNLMTKLAFNRGAESLGKKPLAATAVVITYFVAGYLFVNKGRLDLLIGVLIGLTEVWMMRGGTIRYPKQMFQQKQGFAQCIKLSRLSLWHPFVWNEYHQNQFMTLDNNQFFIEREKRLQLSQVQTQQ